jgi:hypothetical protein
VIVSIERGGQHLIDPIVLKAVGWLYDFPFIIPSDSIYSDLDLGPGKPFARDAAMCIYVGTHGFASPEYFDEQYRDAIVLADSHPVLRERIRGKIARAQEGHIREEMETLKASFRKEEVLAEDGDIKGVLYLK